MFAGPVDEPRARRATDLVLLLVCSAGLLFLTAAAAPPPGFDRAITRFLFSWPAALDPLWQVVVDLQVVLALGLVAAAALRRWRLARDLAASAVVALLVAALAVRVVTGSWPDLWDALQRTSPPPGYPSVRTAVAAAVIVTSSPHLVRPLRRFNRWVLGLCALATTMLGATTAMGAVAALLVAGMSAAAVHLLFGTGAGRPSLADIRQALDELDVPTRWLGVADRQEAGVFLVRAETDTGDELAVKVYGRDSQDTALVSTIWRTVWVRDATTPLRLGRLQQVAHEAFLTLLARQAGILTDTVVTAGRGSHDDALLVLRRAGPPLSSVPAGELPEDPSARVWATVRALHAAGITHGAIDDQHLTLVGGQVGIADLHDATTAPSPAQRRADEAQALATTALLVGTDRAVTAAHSELGTDALTAVLPYLQPVVLTKRQRQWVRDGDLDLDQLRNEAATAAGVETPALVKLHRVTLGSIARMLLLAIALVALISGIGGLDWEVVRDEVADASGWLLAAGFIAAQVPRITQAVSTLGASPVPLPLGPVYRLQLAISYVNLAVPTSAARVAVNIRFFQRHGVPPGTALAAGALDGFAGFLVQTSLLVGLVLITPGTLDLDTGSAVPDGVARILLFALTVGAIAIAVVAVMGRTRRFVLGWARRLAVEALAALRGLRTPRRLGLLLGGNLATEILFASALGVFTRALGYPLGLDELLLVNIGVALLAGLMPIPGGIGVAESGLVFGLSRYGMPEETAFAAAMLYRIASFYLPPIWGFLSLRSLERDQLL